MYGYEVLKRLRELYEGVWCPKTGSLYPSLRRLEDHGLIISKEKEGVSYYSLAPEGERWIAEVLRILSIDVMMTSRWFMRMLREASGKPLAASEGALDLHQEEFGKILRAIMDKEHESDQDKLDHLRRMKTRMKIFIQQIESMEREPDGIEKRD